MPEINPRFGAEDVIEIASRLNADDTTFVVGGQATNLWAWYYRDRSAVLQSDDPLTSADIDYFGSFRVAQDFAALIGGRVFRPDADTMNSPSTAKVVTEYNGKTLILDFLNGILGVKLWELEAGVCNLIVEADLAGEPKQVEVAVLHPVLCLRSRVANMMHPALRRRDPFAWRQLHAAIAVVTCYIDENLDLGDWKEAKLCLSDLFAYLRSDPMARQAEAELGVDLLAILRGFADDERVEARYRQNQLTPMIERIAVRAEAAIARR
ncbi:hypothetical protein Q8W71_17145 [Methylobacterium sp. NEAU 140]|uniref:hypothetical protein n=1 Tax=Methylobacterium sp. NEAU 140 TaxID=3064945 RepID=UPI0027366037|nr:hypothetical protein [Methylobacterium sp. NEAU 140]MDP4024356.1 hypothetical protein [Methylobacterium sp. NEAU 140]